MKPFRDTWPWGTVMCLVAALVASAWPAAGGWLVGERAALRGGEIWRAWTAHGVHFSWSHLAWSGLVWLVAGGLMERENRRVWAVGVFLAAPLITVAALAFDGQLARYGGLSGLACVPLAWLGLGWARQGRGLRRAAGAGVLIALVAKVGWELGGGAGAPLLANFEPTSDAVRGAPWAHAVGTVAGLSVWLVEFGDAKVKR